jgi:hypothetical protein
MQINHIDGNKLNNNVKNLEMVTAKENAIHAVKNSLCNHAKGESRSDLEESDIIKIFKLKHRGLNNAEISKIYNTSRERIRDIANRKNWKHVKIENKYLPQKKEIDYLKNLSNFAKKYGFALLSTNYVNARTKYCFKCKCGEEFSCWPQYLKVRKGCKSCGIKSFSKSKTIKIEKVKTMAANIGYTLIYKKIISAKHNHKYRCHCGNIVYKKVSQLKTSRSCYKCRISKRLPQIPPQ